MCSICGIDCRNCELKQSCSDCKATGGRPFGGECAVAECCRQRGQESCLACEGVCALRESLIVEFNALAIPDMPQVTGLNALLGRYANSVYTFPGGEQARLLNDDAVYLGNLLPSADGTRFFGVVGNQRFLTVSVFGQNGEGAELLVYKKR